MTQQAVGYEDSDIPLESGRLRVRRWGAADAPAVLCVPGLSANLCGFDRLAERLTGDTRQLVAIDLRGRGRSEVTGAGTYGWRSHARDVLGIADAVEAPSFAVTGQSSGAAIAMTCAQLEPSRVERLVLVDLAGSPDARAAVPVVASVSRLGTVYPSAQAAIALIKQTGIVPEWDEYWDRYFRYELRDVDGGVAASTDRGAVLEDLGYGNAMYWPGPEAPIHALWQAISMPALVLRARREILPGFGFILPAAEAERFAATVPSARVVEIDANHYTITTHDDSIAAIGAFLRTSAHRGRRRTRSLRGPPSRRAGKWGAKLRASRGPVPGPAPGVSGWGAPQPDTPFNPESTRPLQPRGAFTPNVSRTRGPPAARRLPLPRTGTGRSAPWPPGASSPRTGSARLPRPQGRDCR